MPTAFSFSGGGYDYVQTTEPTDPLDAESWLHLDADGNGNATVKIWDASAGQWERTGVVSHGDLTDVTEDAHHSPVSVTAPLTEDGTQGLGLDLGDGVTVSNGLLVADLGNGLGIDANGRVYILSGAVGADELAPDAVDSAHIAGGAVDQAHLSFSTATQAELDSHATDGTNPHGVTAAQAGAIADAAGTVDESHLSFSTATQAELDSHAGDTTNPHNVTDSQTGAASALSNHASDSNAHHSRYTDSEAANAAPVQSVNGQTGAVTVGEKRQSITLTSVNTESQTYTDVGAILGYRIEAGPVSSSTSIDVNFADGTTRSRMVEGQGSGQESGSGSARYFDWEGIAEPIDSVTLTVDCGDYNSTYDYRAAVLYLEG